MSFALVKSDGLAVAAETDEVMYIVDAAPDFGQPAKWKIPDEVNATILHVLPGICVGERLAPGKVNIQDRTKEDDQRYYEFIVDRRDANGDPIDVKPYVKYSVGPLEGRMFLVPVHGDPSRVVKEKEVSQAVFEEFYPDLPRRLKVIK